MYDVHGYNVPSAEKVKRAVTKSRVAVIGGINSPELAEEIIATGKADFVIIGRQAFADPDFPNKAAAGREDMIRRCVRCYHCYPGGYPEHESELPQAEFMQMVLPRMIRQVGQCGINPLSNFHILPENFPAPRASRKVLVAGGGVAGMQAALTAIERGHRVTIVEKSGSLGGLLNFTDFDRYKVDLRNYKNVLVREVAASDVEVLLDTEVTPQFIEEFDPEVVILAVGSSPLTPPIQGVEHAADAMALYRDPEKVGEKVVMIGGGLVGCETGLHFAAEGRDVTIVEMTERAAPEAYAMPRVSLLDEMEKQNVRLLLGHKCVEMRPNGVKLVDDKGGEIFLGADTICYSVGMVPNRDVVEPLKKAAKGCRVFEIGDCTSVGKVATATESAYRAALEIV
jgi:NADPH-dependent 2,4-dienoyl-CoA reductase/sulfur reductase-like enzyme